MSNRLLIFANDAASANVTIAYAYLYGNQYKEITAYPENTAVQLYQQHIEKYISTKSIQFNTSDTIVTGTSGLNSSYELRIIKEAKKENVKKTIMIVDNTSNFNMRFTDNNQIIREDQLADDIWIFEKRFTSDIDYINQRIIYKENIYNIYIKELYKKNKPKIIHPFIIQNCDNYLVILTEYLYELYRLKFGFTEYDMLEYILKMISDENIQIPIFLKLHPREHKNKFNILLRKYSHLDIIKDDCNIQELIYYGKIILGINSSVFIECNIFNKPSYSVQIGFKEKHSIKNDTITNIITSKIQLKNILKKI